MKRFSDWRLAFMNSKDTKGARESIEKLVTKEALLILNGAKFENREFIASKWSPVAAYVKKFQNNCRMRQWNSNSISCVDTALYQCVDGKEF